MNIITLLITSKLITEIHELYVTVSKTIVSLLIINYLND